ncbi:hypothetical protein VTK73DRAFT_868 [Phialemonium thermophilum]|uniref:Argonaute complex, subunit Arb1 n=1 Tax=Phialemonium thermophilum TaxID=223376 RepID=A0ABR3VU78_9PEZI
MLRAAEDEAAEPMADLASAQLGADPPVAATERKAPSEDGQDATSPCPAVGSAGSGVQIEKTKRKRKGKGKAARGPGALGKSRGSGFEDYYCDPPTTPAEALDEKANIYPPHRPFVHRIEECIQRYRARRRLDSQRAYLFSRYLALGGIDDAPRQFQSSETIELADATAAEIQDSMSAAVIHRTGGDARFYNPQDPEHWVVDFAGVAAGFFSDRVITLASSNLAIVEVAVSVVQNFLNYVLYHDVCPEYAADIMRAKRVCDQARDQIPRLFALWDDLPGDFHAAARALYGTDDRDEGASGSRRYEAMESRRARIVFWASIATMDKDVIDNVRAAKHSGGVRVVETVEQTFEIEEFRDPSDETLQKYYGVKDPASGAPGTMDPCGTVVLQTTTIQEGWDRPSADGERQGAVQEELLLNQKVRRHLVVGMKLKLVLCTLNVGVKFIREVKDIYPSYYTFLPQELMLHYKEPVPNDRPAPSAEDLDAQDAEPCGPDGE